MRLSELKSKLSKPRLIDEHLDHRRHQGDAAGAKSFDGSSRAVRGERAYHCVGARLSQEARVDRPDTREVEHRHCVQMARKRLDSDS